MQFVGLAVGPIGAVGCNESGLVAPQSIEAEVELQLRTVELREQIVKALGSRQAAVQPMLEELEALFAAGPALDLDAAWAALDELEDQLEALSR